MNARLLNREFQAPADGWYQVEAKGYHPAVAADGTKIVQVIDAKSITSIVNRFNAAAAAGTLPHGKDMLIDHEHFRHDKSKETIAYGWANKLRASPDGSGIDTWNPWTTTGNAAVAGGDYRFISTEYDGPMDQVFEEVPAAQIPVDIRNKFSGYKFLRPLMLTGLSLTNDPNNKGQKGFTITNRTRQSAVVSPAATRPLPPAARQTPAPVFAGDTVFQAIVSVVRNRTGMDYSTAFSKVGAENADLFQRKTIDATSHTAPFHRLLNRTQSGTGLGACASTELAAENVSRLTKQFFPALAAAPVAMQWDVITRAATTLEKFGVPYRMLNRTSTPTVQPANWKAANARASTVLGALELREMKYTDIGLCDNYQNMHPSQKTGCFKSQIDRLMHEEGLTVAAAFERLKETHPIFWADSILTFDCTQ